MRIKGESTACFYGRVSSCRWDGMGKASDYRPSPPLLFSLDPWNSTRSGPLSTQNTKAFNLSISELAPSGPLLPALKVFHFKRRDAWCKQQGDGVRLAQGGSEGRFLRRYLAVSNRVQRKCPPPCTLSRPGGCLLPQLLTRECKRGGERETGSN